MKHAKRIVSLLLVLTMALGMLTACKNKSREDDVDEGARVLKVGIMQDSTIPDFDTNAFTLYLEEVCDLDIKWFYLANTSQVATQQLTLMATTKEEMPDVVVGVNMGGKYALNQFGEDGYIIDLRDLIEDYAPNYKEHLANLDEEMRKYVEEAGTDMNTGEFYAMPRVIADVPDNMRAMGFINKTWLDKLGLKVPTNTTELVNVCRAFLTKDPNGNGEQDEIPMLGGVERFRTYLLNAFVEVDTDLFNVKNGKLWDPVVTDEYRQALAFVKDMVEEDLITELTFTLSNAEMKNLISPTDGPGKVGIFFGHPEVLTFDSSDVLKDYVALAPLADATGKGGYNIIVDRNVYWQGFITKDCKNTALAMQFLDAFYSDEAVSRQRHGEKDVNWVYEEGTNPLGTASYVKLTGPQAYFDMSMNKLIANPPLLGIESDWNYLATATQGEGRNAEVSRLLKEVWDIKQNEGKKQAEKASQLTYTQEEYEKREEKSGTVSSYITSQATLFMTGERDPRSDKDWQDYKTTLEKLGRSELMEVAQSAYNRKVGK